MNEVQKADPQARRRAFLMVALGIVIGTLIYLLERYAPVLLDWIGRDPARSASRLKLVFAILTVAITGPTLGLSVYFWRLGGRVVEAGRCPPPGFSVVRDTPIVTGPAARRRGRLLQAMAAVLAFVAMATPVVFYRIVTLLES